MSTSQDTLTVGSRPHLLRALQFDPFAGDFGDPGDKQLSDKIVKCRKEGICHNCRETIHKGQWARSRADVIDGDLMWWKWCETCTQLMANDDHEGYESRLKD